MDVLDGRSVVSLSDHELIPALDALDADIIRRLDIRLQLIARIENTGYAQELGARDAVELVSLRYRRDRAEVWRDVRLARALPRYTAVNTALTHGIEIHTQPDTHHTNTQDTNTHHTQDTEDTAALDTEAKDTEPLDAEALDAEAQDSGDEGVRMVRPMQTAHAVAIVSELERVRTRVPVDDLDIAEEQLVQLAAHLSPAELRTAAKQICNLLDSDGPEPDERKAYERESLTLTNADKGVKFKGYLANENAELLRAVVHAGARPHKTTDGEPDPRPRDKRQADALTTALTTAATIWDTTTSRPPTPPTTDPTRAGSSAESNADPSAQPGTGSGTDPSAEPGTGSGTDPSAQFGTGSGARPGKGSGAARSSDASAAGGDADGSATAPTTFGVSVWTTGAAGDPTGNAAADGTANVVSGAGCGNGGSGGHGGSGGGRNGSGRRGLVPGYGAKACITVTIDLQDLKAATADAIGHTVYSDGLSAATIRRLACDAKVIPIVLRSNSEPLDVGRAERLVTKPIRHTLNARDKGCVVCGAPPVMCDAHHLVSWIDGGETKIDNLALLCRRDHVSLHHGRWTLTITNGIVHVARPTWADPPPLHLPKPPAPPHTNPARPKPPDADPARPKPPAADPARPKPPDADPARPKPPDADSARLEPARRMPALPDPPSARQEPVTNPQSQSSAPDDAWGGTVLPAATPTGVRTGRWKADAATYAEAARFAIWDTPTSQSDSGPPSFATI